LVINVGEEADVEVIDAVRGLGDRGAGVRGVVNVVAAEWALNLEVRIEDIALCGLVFRNSGGGQDAGLQDDLGGVEASAHHRGMHWIDGFCCGGGFCGPDVFRWTVGVVGVVAATVGEGVSLLLEIDLNFAKAAVPLGVGGRVGDGVVV